jgi:transposase
MRHQLNDDEWALIEDIFPEAAATGRPRRDPRELLNGMLWILRTGSPWRDLPPDFGPWKTVYNTFDRWRADGTLEDIRARLLTGVVEADLLDPELWCIDGSVVRAARCAGGGGKKGIRTNPKITL